MTDGCAAGGEGGAETEKATAAETETVTARQ